MKNSKNNAAYEVGLVLCHSANVFIGNMPPATPSFCKGCRQAWCNGGQPTQAMVNSVSDTHNRYLTCIPKLSLTEVAMFYGLGAEQGFKGALADGLTVVMVSVVFLFLF